LANINKIWNPKRDKFVETRTTRRRRNIKKDQNWWAEELPGQQKRITKTHPRYPFSGLFHRFLTDSQCPSVFRLSAPKWNPANNNTNNIVWGNGEAELALSICLFDRCWGFSWPKTALGFNVVPCDTEKK